MRSGPAFAWKSERIAGPKFGHAMDDIIRLVGVDACIVR